VTEDKPKNRLLLSQIIAISQNCLRTNINIEDLETIKNVLLHLKEFKKEKELPNDKKIQRLESAIWEFEGKIKLIQLENENEIMQELVSKTHVLLMSVFGNTTMGDSIRKFEKETRGNQLLHLQAEQGRLKCHLLQLTEELKNVMPGNMQQSIEARLANLQISEASLHNMEK
jgi:flagellar biosynthesis component FlhA